MFWNKFWCAAPVNIEFLGKTSNRKNFYFIVQLIWSLIVISCVSISTYYQHKDADQSMGFLTRMLYIAEYVIGTANLVLIIGGIQYQKKFYTIFLEKIIMVDLNMESAGIETEYKSCGRYLKRAMISYALFFSCVIFSEVQQFTLYLFI